MKIQSTITDPVVIQKLKQRKRELEKELSLNLSLAQFVNKVMREWCLYKDNEDVG